MNSTLSIKFKSADQNITNSAHKLNEANNRRNMLNSTLKSLTNKWEQIQSPFGNLPIDSANLLAIFPITLASGFLVCRIFLSESINLCRVIHYIYEKLKKEEVTKRIVLIAPFGLIQNHAILFNIEDYLPLIMY